MPFTADPVLGLSVAGHYGALQAHDRLRGEVAVCALLGVCVLDVFGDVCLLDLFDMGADFGHKLFNINNQSILSFSA